MYQLKKPFSDSGRVNSWTVGSLVVLIVFIAQSEDSNAAGGRGSCFGNAFSCFSNPFKYEERINEQTRKLLGVNFDRNSNECQNWVDAHLYYCGEAEYKAAKDLLAHVNYESFAEFAREMVEHLQDFKKDIGKRKFVWLIEPGKSSEWIYESFNFVLKKKRNQFEVVFAQDLDQYLAQNSDITDVLRVDDAIYSGGQFRDYAEDLKSNRSQSQHFTLHAVVPYFSEAGKQRILMAADSRLTINLISKNPIKSIPEVVSQENLHVLKRMYPQAGDLGISSQENRWKGITATFFQHKVADSASVITDFFHYGRVKCTHKDAPINLNFSNLLVGAPTHRARRASILGVPGSPIKSLPLEFSCVPFIQPPYKKEKTYEPVDQFCQNPSSSHVSTCKAYMEKKEILVQRIQATAENVEEYWQDLKTGNLARIQKYRSTGGKLTLTNLQGATPLLIAAQNHQWQVVKFLIEDAPLCDVHSREVIRLAKEQNRSDVIETFSRKFGEGYFAGSSSSKE